MRHGLGLKAFATAVLLAATVAACGGDSPQPTPTPTAPPAPTETATAPAPTPTPVPAAPSPAATTTTTATASPTPTSPTPTEAATPTPEPTSTPTSTPEPTATPTRTPAQEDEPPEPVEPDDSTPAVRPTLPQSPVFDAPEGVFTDITVGVRHACALTEDGEAVCWDIWTGNISGTRSGPFTSIEAEGDDTCAITVDGHIVCWPVSGGAFPDHRPDPSRDAPLGRYRAFSWTSEYYFEGDRHACAVTDEGEGVCWSSLAGPQTNALTLPELLPWEYAAIDVRHSYFGAGLEFLTVCGLLRTGSAVCSSAARLDGTAREPSTWILEGRYASVAVSGRYSCALSFTGEIEGCGGHGESGTTRYTAISPGEKHVCAVADEGHLECWPHGSGWFGSGDLFLMDPPAPSPAGYLDVSVGVWFGCALDGAGGVTCWTVRGNWVAPPDPAPGRYAAVSDGLRHTCALTEDGEVVCWGWNNFGQVNAPPGRYKAISAGFTGTCALTQAGMVVCWGQHTYAHNFNAGPYRSITTTMAAGFPITCAITGEEAAVCHGLGMGPYQVPEVSYGSIHAVRRAHDVLFCALSVDGAMVCQRGDDAPWAVDGRFAVLSDGPGPLCRVNDAGEVFCWGAFENWYPDVPAGDYVAISVGPDHGCALTEAGEVRCWGSFPDGEPADPPPGRYVAISSSQDRVCAVTDEGHVVCWGDTDYVDPPASDPYW